MTRPPSANSAPVKPTSSPAGLNILYVGQLLPGQTAAQRFKLLGDLGHHVVGLNPRPIEVWEAERRLWSRLRRRLFGPTDLAGINAGILEAVGKEPFDILWMDKALVVERATIEGVKRLRPGCRIVGFSLDDMMLRGCTSRQFREHLPLYDIFFTNKSFGVAELKALGARRVEFFGNGYDPVVHAPVTVSAADRAALGGAVGFIGDYEAERARSMRFLAERGVPVRVWGPNWRADGRWPELMKVEGRSLIDRDYARAICAFDINLGFLRKCSRDLQTTRSVEIPACGGFMLGERTSEHLGLFREGVEAEFFASDEELLGKVRYYMEHPAERGRIAAAGRARCLASGYSNADRLGRMIEMARSMRGQDE